MSRERWYYYVMLVKGSHVIAIGAYLTKVGMENRYNNTSGSVYKFKTLERNPEKAIEEFKNEVKIL